MDRLERERRTLGAMLQLYCRGTHGVSTLCPACSSLLEYSASRLDTCRFGAAKPACSACPVHCYQAPQREAIRQVMRYAGPRMLLRHPVLALLHLAG
jgi:hypothetical protein